MAQIEKVNGRNVIDYMARDFDSLLQSMQEMVPDKLPEWKEYASEADFGNVLLQLFAHMGDIISYYQDRVANESFLGTAQSRSSIIDHLRLIGYRLSTAVPASATLKLLVPKDKIDQITEIKRGWAFATKSQKDKPSIRFEYTGKKSLLINSADWLEEPNSDANKMYFDGIPVEEGRFIADERLGTSNGKPDQRFRLAHSGLILRWFGENPDKNNDITVTTVLENTQPDWILRESLAFSREGQKDYTIEIDENDVATIIFGDNAFGAIPVKGSTVYATYRVGGGIKGNVPAESIQTIADAPALSSIGAQIINSIAATGGSERESIEHAAMNAPGVFRSLKRAVTTSDYEHLALNFKGVGKVRAEAGNWNKVHLFIAPDGGGKVSDILRKNLLAYFEDKRPITTIIEIEDVDYVKIYITATIGVKRYYTFENVKGTVFKTVSDLLLFDNVSFKQKLFLSQFYNAIVDIDGVLYVTITEFRTKKQDPGTISRDGIIELSKNQLPKIPDDKIKDEEYINGMKSTVTQEEEIK